MAEGERAEQILSSIPEAQLELARVWSAKGVVYMRRGDYKKAIEFQEKAIWFSRDWVRRRNRVVPITGSEHVTLFLENTIEHFRCLRGH